LANGYDLIDCNKVRGIMLRAFSLEYSHAFVPCFSCGGCVLSPFVIGENMHEMSIAVELLRELELLVETNNVKRVVEFTVSAGKLRGVVPEALDIAFASLGEGTCAGGAKLNLEFVPTIAQCRGCNNRFEPGEDYYLCPKCNKADVEIIEGNDIILKSVTCE
jgi:hydrogenase nickel incorporation protein HypA/HybF